MVGGATATMERRPPVEECGKPHRWSAREDGNSGGSSLAAAGFVATLIMVLLLWWVAAQPSHVEVPNVVGMPRAQAETLLKGMGLTVRATSDQAANQQPGTVLRTDPPVGQQLDQGSGVSLMLASPPRAVIPSGSVAPPAVQQFPLAGETPPVGQSAPAQQSPAAPQPLPVVIHPVVIPPPVMVPPLVVVERPAPVQRPVPDVIGFDQYRAQRVLVDNRLKVGSVTEEQSNQRAGTVLRTDPRAGVAVWPGSTVDLVVAKPGQVVVPTVVGYDQAGAKRTLVGNGLKVGSVTEEQSNQRAGTVLRTDPRASTAVSPGSTIDLVIAKPTGKPSTDKHPKAGGDAKSDEPPQERR